MGEDARRRNRGIGAAANRRDPHDLDLPIR
jgi:hypothetical protein